MLLAQVEIRLERNIREAIADEIGLGNREIAGAKRRKGV